MANTFETVEQVQTARKSGQGIVMNMVAAIAALKATPVKAPRASSSRDSEFGNDVRALFEEAKKNGIEALSHAQVAAMYAAAKNVDMPSGKNEPDENKKFTKKFYEHCLAHSDQPSKLEKHLAKNPSYQPTYHYENGLFSLK